MLPEWSIEKIYKELPEGILSILSYCKDSNNLSFDKKRKKSGIKRFFVNLRIGNNTRNPMNFVKRSLAAVVAFIITSSACLFAAKPIIGISSYISDGACSADLSYIRAVEAAGGLPLVIPVNTNDEELGRLLSLVDGLIMTGGADFDPVKWYGEEPRREMKRVEPERDLFDVKCLRYAVAKGIPVLGICRGEQCFAAAFGGSLYQDIPTMIAGNVKHSQPPTDPKYPLHSISIEKGSLLHSLLGTEKIGVNSWHHQCIKDMPKGLKATAVAADGVVEAVERCGKIEGYEDAGGWLLGVQFHPELLIVEGGLTEYLPIFEALVEAASGSK